MIISSLDSQRQIRLCRVRHWASQGQYTQMSGDTRNTLCANQSPTDRNKTARITDKQMSLNQ